jgi:hypothetical protein
MRYGTRDFSPTEMGTAWFVLFVQQDVGPNPVSLLCRFGGDRVFLSIWRVNKPDDPVFSMALIGVIGTRWTQLPPWHRQLDPILRNALAYQKLFDPLRSS